MKTNINLDKFLDTYTEEDFILSLLSYNVKKLNHLLSDNGLFMEMSITDFLLNLKEFIDETTIYSKKYSLQIRPSEVVHVFQSKDNSRVIELILKIKNQKINRIVTETKTVTQEEFELMQFYN